jgi:cytochrome P450
MNLLLDHPDYWDVMRGDNALIANVVEETLRLESPVQIMNRRTVEEFDFAGRQIASGASVLVAIAAANRDPSVFSDPARFDPRRENANKQLAFTIGAHHCMGSSLARLEGLVAFRTLLERMPEVRRAAPAQRRPHLVARGFTNVPVAFTSQN